MIRNSVAVITGFLTWTVLWVAMNQIVKTVMPGPFGDDGSVSSTGVLVAFILLSFVFSIIAGFTTASVAHDDRMKPSLTLGIVLLVVGIFVEGSYWAVLPVWYHLIFLVLLIPGALIGALIRISKEPR
jgi:hypothetical protein